MTADEIRAAISADPALLALKEDTTALAAALSVGRTKLVPTEIGNGTILATLDGIGAGGGAFLDSLVAIGASNRDVFWTMDLIKAGRCRIDLAATRSGLSKLAAAVPTLAPAVTELLKLGYAPDVVTSQQVIDAIYVNGEMVI